PQPFHGRRPESERLWDARSILPAAKRDESATGCFDSDYGDERTEAIVSGIEGNGELSDADVSAFRPGRLPWNRRADGDTRFHWNAFFGCRTGAAHCLRQRGEPAAGARSEPPPRDCDPARSRGDPSAASAESACGEPVAQLSEHRVCPTPKPV